MHAAKHRGPTGRRRTLERTASSHPPAPTPERKRRGYWKVTGKERVLLAVFFSPGTGSTVAVTV